MLLLKDRAELTQPLVFTIIIAFTIFNLNFYRIRPSCLITRLIR